MRKPRYQLYIDGRLAYQADHLKMLKEHAQFEFEHLNAFHAEIKTGNKTYAWKFYDSKCWH